MNHLKTHHSYTTQLSLSFHPLNWSGPSPSGILGFAIESLVPYKRVKEDFVVFPESTEEYKNLLRGPEPVSKYEKSESSSSGQNRDSRRNFLSRAAAAGS